MKLILVLTASLLVIAAVSADSEETTHPHHKLEDLHPGLILINQNIPIAKSEPHPHFHFASQNHSSRIRRDSEIREKLGQMAKGNFTGVVEKVKKVVMEGFGG